MDKNSKNAINSNKNVFTKESMVSFASEFGFVIALPLILFVFVGRRLDARYGTNKFFVLLGILLALVSSIIYLSKRIYSIRIELTHKTGSPGLTDSPEDDRLVDK